MLRRWGRPCLQIYLWGGADTVMFVCALCLCGGLRPDSASHGLPHRTRRCCHVPQRALQQALQRLLGFHRTSVGCTDHDMPARASEQCGAHCVACSLQSNMCGRRHRSRSRDAAPCVRRWRRFERAYLEWQQPRSGRALRRGRAHSCDARLGVDSQCRSCGVSGHRVGAHEKTTRALSPRRPSIDWVFPIFPRACVRASGRGMCMSSGGTA